MNFTTETKNQIEKQEIIQTKKGEVSEYLVKIVFKEKCSPEKFTIKWQEPQIDMMGFWGPMNGTDNNITAEWWPRQVNSRTASGLPLFTLYSKANENKVTVALSDPSTPCTLSTGAVEENGCVSVKIVSLKR